MGHSCRQKCFRLLELCATAPSLHPRFCLGWSQTIGKAGFGAEGLVVQSTGGIWLLSRTHSYEMLLFLD